MTGAWNYYLCTFDKEFLEIAYTAFFWHTASDDSVPVENSVLYANELSKYKIPYEMHIFPYGVHGMGLSEEDEYIGQWKELLINWLTKFIIK